MEVVSSPILYFVFFFGLNNQGSRRRIDLFTLLVRGREKQKTNKIGPSSTRLPECE